MKKVLVAALVVAAASAMVVPVTAGADPGGGALVVKLNSCGLSWGPNEYSGEGTVVTTPGSDGFSKFNCTADLVSGPGVTETTHLAFPAFGLECKVVQTKSGKANISCH